jgi:hypothetical protein
VAGRSFADVLLVTNGADADVSGDERDKHPPVSLPFDLGEVVLDRLPEPRDFMDSCEPVAFSDQNLPRQCGQRYSFIRDGAPGNRVDWDPDERIMTAVAPSRLLRPDDADAHYAGRIQYTGGQRRVFPLDNGFRAYWLTSDKRTWLDQQDAEALRDLIARWNTDQEQVPKRIKHALWLHESAVRIKYLEIRIPHTVTALEALINTDSGRLGDQFCQRVEWLADELGIVGVDRALTKRVWRLRSRWTHGDRVEVTGAPKLAEELERLQTVLAQAILRAINDHSFRGWFDSRGTIRSHLPVAIETERADTADGEADD